MAKYIEIPTPGEGLSPDGSGGSGGPEKPVLKGKYREVTAGDTMSEPKGAPTKERGFFNSWEEITRDPFRLNEAKIALRTMGKGIPILGNAIENTQEMKDYAEEAPMSAAGLRIAGGTLPLLAAGGPIGAIGGLGRQVLASGALGGMLGIGDNLTDPDRDKNGRSESKLSDTLWGAGAGAAGPILAKALSPTMPLKPVKPDANLGPGGKLIPPKGYDPNEIIDLTKRGKPAPGYKFSRDRIGPEAADAINKAKEAARESAKAKDINRPMPAMLDNDRTVRALSAAALGYMGHGVFGPAGLAAAALPYTPHLARGAVRGARKYKHMTWAGKNIKGLPISTKDLTRALLLQQGTDKDPNDE